MDKQTVDNILFEISGKLESLIVKLGVLSETLLKHEHRITELEQVTLAKQEKHCKQDLKDFLLKWLMIGLVAALGTIVTLTGSAGLIMKLASIMGN